MKTHLTGIFLAIAAMVLPSCTINVNPQKPNPPAESTNKYRVQFPYLTMKS